MDNNVALIAQCEAKAKQWLTPDFDETTRKAVQAMLDNADKTELVESFYRDLEFGTGGLRGIMGAGTNRMNIYTVGMATQGFANYLKKNFKDREQISTVVCYDCRNNSDLYARTVANIFSANGIKVYLFDEMRPTPECSFAIRHFGAQGGVNLTASHNPRQWNALKLLNHEGEFLTKDDGNAVLAMAEKEDFDYADVDHIGTYRKDDSFDDRHIEAVLALDLVDTEAIRKRGFRVVVDAINSVGGVILPKFLDRLGVGYTILNGEANGDFAHNPEPLEKNLGGIMGEVAAGGYDLGIVVDPDVDRLAFIQEDGKMYGEEYTLVSVADYILDHVKGATVSNLSSTRALRDVTERHGCQYFASAVGEVNVTTKMKEVGAVIGGEGNGGVIYPESHYGRDALVGIALFLSSLAQKGLTCSELRKTFPTYYIAKNRIDLTPDTDMDAILGKVKERFGSMDDVRVTDIDGVKLDFPTKWVHLRKSNTEPIMRVYSEAATMEEADALGKELMDVVYEMTK